MNKVFIPETNRIEYKDCINESWRPSLLMAATMRCRTPTPEGLF